MNNVIREFPEEISTGIIISKTKAMIDHQNSQYVRNQIDKFAENALQILKNFNAEVIESVPYELKDIVEDMLNFCHDIKGEIVVALQNLDEENYIPNCSYCQDTNRFCEVCVL